MMYRIVAELTIEELTDYFLSDPALCYLALPDSQLTNLYENREFIIPPLSYILGIYLGNELVAVLNYTYFSEICVNIHPFLRSKYHHTPMWGEIQEHLRRYFIENTQVKKVIAMVPKPCKNIHKTCRRYGFKLEGRILNSVIWRNEITDTLMYGLTIRE